MIGITILYRKSSIKTVFLNENPQLATKKYSGLNLKKLQLQLFPILIDLYGYHDNGQFRLDNFKKNIAVASC